MATSGAQSETTGTETFATSIQVKAGDLIGVDNESTKSEIGFASVPGSEYLAIFGQMVEGANTSDASQVDEQPNEEVAFNADVEYELPSQPGPGPIVPPPTEAHCVVPN